MQQPQPAPFTWIQHLANALQWPAVVIAAFWLGRYVQRIETRVVKAEANIQALIERHLPHIHNALAEIRGLLQGRR